MAKQTNTFYDVVFSPDDDGWYCSAYNRRGEDLYETGVCDTRKEAEKLLMVKYPEATLIKVIDNI